jgi:hypothetical protein
MTIIRPPAMPSLTAPVARAGPAIDRGSLTYLSAGANLRPAFSDEDLASIYLERTSSRAEP